MCVVCVLCDEIIDCGVVWCVLGFGWRYAVLRYVIIYYIILYYIMLYCVVLYRLVACVVLLWAGLLVGR